MWYARLVRRLRLYAGKRGIRHEFMRIANRAGAAFRLNALTYGAYRLKLAFGSLTLLSFSAVAHADQSYNHDLLLDSIKRYKATLKRTETLEGYYNAFVEENEHGNKFLSQQGFARAMLSRRLICVSEEKIRDTCNAFTNELLGDDNGNISLEEFHLLMSALQTPLEHISIYFRVMDVDGNGAIDKFEYEVFMRRLCALEGIQLQSLSNTRLLRHFFGVDGKGTVTNAQLREFATKLKRDVMELEFNLYAQEHVVIPAVTTRCKNKPSPPRVEKYIKPAELAIMLVSRCKPSAIQAYAQCLTKVEVEEVAGISLADVLNLDKLLTEYSHDLLYALSIFCKGGAARIQKSDLERAGQVVAGIRLDSVCANVLLDVFDRDGMDGLQFSELEFALQQRSHNARLTIEPKNLAQRLQTCMSDLRDST